MVAATVRISARAKSMRWREINRTPFVPRIVSNAGPVSVNAPLKPLISKRISRCIGSCKRMASLSKIKRDQRAKIETELP